jgi:CheY-like chemotaxis protein
MSYLVDQQAGEVEFVCPGCTTVIRLRGTEAASGAATTQATPAGPVAQAVAQAPRLEQAIPQAPPQEVVCPRCRLHFTPGRVTLAPEDTAQKLKVLVVEDLAIFREIAQDALAASYEVLTATTVAEAKAALSQGGVDLLVLDLTLDGGDHGLGLLQTMAEKPCPILIYTAQDESEMYGDSWDELRGLGADDIVIKGMNVGESLLRKVNALLGRGADDEDPVANTVTSRE